jgi:uncharacterized OsmC-like protein
MATSRTIYLGELRTENVHISSGQKLITDAPLDNQGKGEAFSPTDLVATALSDCMITIMGIKARDKGLDLAGTTIETTRSCLPNPDVLVRSLLKLPSQKMVFQIRIKPFSPQ